MNMFKKHWKTRVFISKFRIFRALSHFRAKYACFSAQRGMLYYFKKQGNACYIKEGSKPQGFGKIYQKDGGMLIGCFEDGLLNGRGVYILPNGAFYEGNF